MADVNELGRKVKAKYPGQYDDLADDEVGRRVKTKFPGAYDDFTDAPKLSTVLPQDRQEFGRRPQSLDESLTQSARFNRGRPQPSMPALHSGPLAEAREDHARRQRRETFEKKPLLERTGERTYDALARGGGQLSRMARQAVGAGLGVARGVNSGDFTPVDIPAWRQFEEGRNQELEQRRLSRPSSFATDVGEGIVEGLPVAAAGYLGGAAAGGGMLATGATGAGMAAAGANWRDPKRAAAQTALGAVAPVLGGKIGQKVGGAVASRLARPAAQGAARAGGEVLGGAAGNVIGSGAEQLGFEGGLNTRELAKQAVIGGALNVPGAIGAARRPARLTENIPAAQPVVARQPEAARPRVEPARQTVEMPRVQARTTAPEVRRQTAEIRYPDAPETQEMPAIRQRIAAENAPTRELPKSFEGQPPEVPAQTKDLAAYSNIVRTSPRQPITEKSAPLTSAEKSDIPTEVAPPRPPKATDENIQALRSRQEELGRLAYDRRGDFTGDLRDEYNRLNSVIREYDNARAPKEFAPPPERGRPERMTTPPEEKETRQAALRKIQHSTLGLVTESPNQKGVPSGKMRVDVEGGSESIIQNPRTRGNRQAAFVKSTGAIPAEAMPELRGRGQVMGMGLGALQPLFERAKKSKPPKLSQLDSGKKFPEPAPAQQPLFDAAAKSPWQDSVLAYYRANLLTNPAGRALDLGSTVVNQFADAAVRPIAAAADVIVSKFNKQRSITGPSLGASGRAFGSIRQGMRDAREVLRTGKQTIDSGADDALYGSEIRTGLGKAADVPINGVFRVLGAMDAPFRRFGFERNLADRAKVAAINESKRGRIPRDQVKARAAELIDRGDIIDAAVRDGERAVLSEPNRISSWLSRQTANSPNARLAIGLIQPFMRIPLNAVLKSADFSGVGGIKALYKIARGVGRKTRGESFFRDVEDQRVFAMNVAAGSFAPAAFLLGMELEDRGKLEGYYYTSKKDFPTGNVPTSIEFGGERYNVNRLGGFVMAPLFIGATYNRLRKEGSEKANALLRSFSGLAQQAPALGYYGAPAKAGRILTAEEPGSEIMKEAGGIASGFIPASGAMGAAAKAIDKGRNREAEGFTGPIMSKIPGLRERLPEKARAAKPAGALAGELKRLGVKPGGPVRRLENEPENLYKERAGKIENWRDQYGADLIKHPMYGRLNDGQRKAALESLHSRISEQANQKRPNVRAFNPTAIVRGVREGERDRRRTDRDKIYVAPQ